MSLLTNEIPSDNESMAITESTNKRKFDEIDSIVKKYKVESPPPSTATTAAAQFTVDSDAVPSEEDQSNSILSDVTENESTEGSSDQNDKTVTFNDHSSTISDDLDDVKNVKSEEDASEILCPQFGQIVNRREFRRAGPYIIGQKLGGSPVDSIVQYLAKKENTNEFVQLKILMLNNNASNEKQQRDERQGKMLLHTEYSLLSLLQGEKGVIQQHGLFSDMAYEEVVAESDSNNNYFTGALRKRLILVLDCVTPHDFDPHSSAYVNLQQYLINRPKMTEIEALSIFYEIVSVVESLHKRNIIHRDLKLGNIVLNKYTNKITITNFCLGKYLLNENDLLYDQRGSPAYISPDVLCGKPYKGKPSDMWALGVVLYMLLCRQFPFFESTPTALFKKIKSAEYFIPMNCEMSKATEQMIKDLLQINPEKRLTATQVRQQLKLIIDSHNCVQNTDHLVPELECNNDDDDLLSPTEKSYKEKWRKIMSDNDQVVPSMSSKPDPAAPAAPISRKRRRSGEKLLLNNISQRGISVQHVGSDARQLNSDDISQLQHLFRSNRNRYAGAGFSETVRPTPSSVFSSSGSSQNRSAMSSVLRLFSTRNNNQSNASNGGGSRTTASSNTSLPRIARSTQDMSASNPNWRFLRFGNSMLNDLFRCATVGRNPNASNVNRQNEQMRMIRRIRRAQPGATNQSDR